MYLYDEVIIICGLGLKEPMSLFAVFDNKGFKKICSVKIIFVEILFNKLFI